MAGETILLVEDNDGVALGLSYGLEKEGFQVIRAATAAEARRLVHEVAADALILDIRLPDGNGFDLCRHFRAAGLRQPILMLTARDELIDKVLGLELGADDYMTKPFELRELVARLHALLRRFRNALARSDELASPSLGFHLSLGDLRLDLAGQRLTRNGQEIHLTATEFRLLALLAQSSGQTLSRDELITRVWGYDAFVGDDRTIDVHIRNLRQKIEADPGHPRLILTVRGAGYRLASK